MANTRKQRYRLDIDDVLSRAFLTKHNADELILGLNESTTDQKLGLQVGGTNNTSWAPVDDLQLVMFDHATRSLKPSGALAQPGLQSIQIPYITGSLYKKDDTTVTTTDSVTAIDMVTQTFTLPASSRWVDIHLVFQYTVRGINAGDQHISLTDLKVLLGAETSQAVSIISSYAAGSSEDNDDTNTITWVAIGEIPAGVGGHYLDNPLTVRVSGIPHDVGSIRSCVTRIGYRGQVDIPPAVVKGVHSYFTPVMLKWCSWAIGGPTPRYINPDTTLSVSSPSFPDTTYPSDPTVWQTVNLPAGGASSASAVILQIYGGGRRNTIEAWTKATLATPDANKLLVYYTEAGEEAQCGHNAQISVPIGSSGGVQSIQLQGLVFWAEFGWYQIFAVGYVS